MKAGSKGLTSNTLFLQALSLCLFCFIIYANTLTHQYALDDSIVIKENRLTQKGIEGIPEIMSKDAFYGFFGDDRNLVAGGRYRPLSFVTFAIEYELFGLNPGISHFVNILLYGGLCVLILLLTISLLKNRFSNEHFFSIPFLIALLFAAHPIHTEAVANIKGRDEIMGLLGAAGALYLFLQFLDTQRIRFLIIAFIVFFLGLLSKENVITYLAVFPLAAYFFRSGKLKETVFPMLGFVLFTIGYLLIRAAFTSSGGFAQSDTVLNNAYALATDSERFATIIYTVGKYFQLLIFPHPLSHDYYYNQIPYQNWTSPFVLLTLVGLVAVGFYTIKGLASKKVYAFGVLYFFITFSIVSNVFFNVGTTMSERLVFMPSFGFVLILPVLINAGVKRFYSGKDYLKIRAIVVGVIVILFAIKTIERNPAWENNEVLFSTDIKYSPNSAKLNNALGGTLVDKADDAASEAEKMELLNEGIFYLNRAVEIYPGYTTAWNILGNAHFKRGDDLQTVRQYYEKALEIAPGFFEANMNLGIVLNIRKQHQEALNYLNRAANNRPGTYEVWYHIGDAYFHLNQPDNAVESLQTAVSVRQNGHEALYKLGLVYGRLNNDFQQAVQFFERAIQIEPNRHFYYEDLGVAYGFMGNHQKAIESFEQVLQLRPNHAQAYRNMGTSYMALGNEAKAREMMARFQELQNR